MKTTRQQNRKANVPSKRKADLGCTGAKKSTKRTGGRSFKPAAEGRCPDIRVERKCVSQTLIPYTKIKLQLFPIDESTRMGLEKDGHNPYLELTLSARKKISSVLKRLNCKWGGSSIALGEPMLFPYNALKNSSSYRRWTLNDNDISAGYVYEAIGSPSIFRLRYGWFSYTEPETFGKLSTSTPIQGFSQSEEKGCRTNKDGPDVEGNKTEVGSEVAVDAEVAIDADNVVNGPADPMDNEPKMDDGLGQSSALWTDSLTNISIGALLSEVSIQGKFSNSDPIIDGLTSISIGGLLSEASLQGKPNNCDPKSAGNDACLQMPQPTSDSFDAYIAAQTNCSQGPRSSTQDPHSSILDAEETCHAFPFQRFSSSEKDVLPLVGSAYPGSRGQDVGSESFNFPNAAEGNCQPVFPEDYACQESEIDLLFSSHTYHDESSLGLSGIKWTDSLGPFDLGLPHLSEAYLWNGII
ncbi:TSL-kinase interacting protein 1 [Juglans microcarpa x Juglans regia]|uniref:TSL-kinase interacting protein 1 n=1 Tax=Juglans microcarpa x Juglans regia TaxID=2249226 RepID=UPI001B7D9342|nr:TSL-kinase interacting protein 1 [Juglans microcarpa x Juglans regia]